MIDRHRAVSPEEAHGGPARPVESGEHQRLVERGARADSPVLEPPLLAVKRTQAGQGGPREASEFRHLP